MLRFVFFSLLLVYSCQIFESKEISVISDVQFTEIQDTDYILVDVRTVEEYESGHIQDAVNFDYYSESFQKEILSSKLVISRAGYSSLMDYQTLNTNAIIIPTPGQTEQEYLAEHLKTHPLFFPNLDINSKAR